MNNKQFKALVTSETDRFKAGEIHRAWREYRYVLNTGPRSNTTWVSGLASGLLTYGIFLCFHMEVAGQLLVVTQLLISLSMFIYLEREDLIWMGKREAEFRQFNPWARLLFPVKT